ncbi:MAG TPA: hypothetical protein VHD59_08005 [Pseudolabrys sp.]|nr:hypothetical protein [Pseudolabrys sp.]
MDMRHLPIVLVLVAGFAAPSVAADVAVPRNVSVVAPAARQLPFPRTERAAAVWDERACWSQCGAHTAWGMADCLRRDAQGLCVERADHADRMCQRTCRTSAGPYVPDIFDF